MLLLVFVVATLNLAVGYALGVGLSVDDLLRLVPRRAAKAAPSEAEEPLLTRPAPAPQPAAEAQAAPVAPSSPKPKPKPADVMASLAAFREKLTAANVELKLTQEDPEKFIESASKLRDANHDYLDEAQDALKHLADLDAAGDKVATATRDAVRAGASRVAEISTKIDGLIDQGLEDESRRAALIEQSSLAREAVQRAEKKATEAIATAQNPAPAGGPTFAKLDNLFDRLEALLDEASADDVRHVAAVRVDPLADADGDGDDTLLASIERAVSELARSMLGEGQLLVPGPLAMILLEGDSFDEAAERVERLRQQVEATTFELDGAEVHATVTCALVDARKGDSRDAVVDQVNLALEESMRQGANRTFHHDGAFPTQTPERAVPVTPRTVVLG